MVDALNMITINRRSNRAKKVGSLPKQCQATKWKSIFGKYDDFDMLSMLRNIALDPPTSKLTKRSDRPLWNQILRLRKVMTLTAIGCAQRKRKLHQYVRDKFKDSSRLMPRVLEHQNNKKVGRLQSTDDSSTSCLINSRKSIDDLEQKVVMASNDFESLSKSKCTTQDKGASLAFSLSESSMDSAPSMDDNSLMVDMDESTSNSTIPLTTKILTIDKFASLPLPSDDALQSSISSTFMKPNHLNIRTPKRSMRLTNFIGDHLQRMCIPIGPRFQADIPEWTGRIDARSMSEKDGECDDTRWLGTRIWPIGESNFGASKRVVGKGRPNSCSCTTKGSISCIKQHIDEERLSLQYDLGPVFFSWKFDKMGEYASLAWTQLDQGILFSLAKRHPKNFLKHAFDAFPLKSKRSIISYYLNVLSLDI